MVLEYTLCSLNDLERLRLISEQTFVTAFEKDNDPKDFRDYVESAFKVEKIQNELLNKNSDFFFVRYHHTIVGYFKINMGDAQTDIRQTDTIELERIYVLEEHQGKGFGKQFLDHIKNLAVLRKKKVLWLGVWEYNTRAIAFYQNEGFTKFDTHPYFIGSDEQTDWLMSFDLSIL